MTNDPTAIQTAIKDFELILEVYGTQYTKNEKNHLYNGLLNLAKAVEQLQVDIAEIKEKLK